MEIARNQDVAPLHSHRRDEYAPFPYLIDSVELTFDLGEKTTRVASKISMRRKGKVAVPLMLDAAGLTILSLSLDGTPLTPSEWFQEGEKVVLPQVPESFVFEAITQINPADNAALEGLYLSNGILCTQCESEGFRRITCYPDRPDVTALFTTRIVADRKKYPVLLSNGNLLEKGDLPGGKHYALWRDPFRKPSYLFALVAGNLTAGEDTFVTRSGRTVTLQVWVEEKDLSRTPHALECLKQAMRWDEERFGREYDLDTYMIVGVDHFNHGAMENKGLNVFNSNVLLADPETATDDDYQAILRVIGHEYFHNWTGNRVTLRDWFQLSLKEGLTIFRDEEFSSDMGSRPVRRISDVRFLRSTQFPEDAGPLAHPVRPDSYVEIGNFYTMTIYRKGAEVVRMLSTLLGGKFRTGMDLYFQRHDGAGATIEDFVTAMEDVSGADLRQFMRWYGQAGTPLLKVRSHYDAEDKSFTLQVRQELPPTPGQPSKKPLLIPLAFGLIDREGNSIPLLAEGEELPGATTKVLEITKKQQSFRFRNVEQPPVPSLLRDFSAPVRIDYPYRDEDLLLLMAHDPDPFCRWEAAQRLVCDLILRLIDDRDRDLSGFISACEDILLHEPDTAFAAEVLTLPTEKYLSELMPVVDVEGLHGARSELRRRIGRRLREQFLCRYCSLHDGTPYSPTDKRQGDRKLKNLCLWYLTAEDDVEAADLCLRQFRQADNMTDRMGALSALNHCSLPQRDEALAKMYERWKENGQVMDKWLTLQALSSLPGTPDRVEKLLGHPVFDRKNPNRVRSLIGAFCQENHLRFHDPSGRGYRFLAAQVLDIDSFNPQMAAKILPPLTRWEKYDATRQTLMKAELERILATKGISRDLYDVAQRGLQRMETAPTEHEETAQEQPGVPAA